MSFSDSRDPNWYTDTGASARMTADAGNLKTNITLYFGSDKIYVGEGIGLCIFHIDDAFLTTSSENLEFELKVVPDINKNLISVSQFTENNSCTFEFSSEKFLIKQG